MWASTEFVARQDLVDSTSRCHGTCGSASPAVSEATVRSEARPSPWVSAQWILPLSLVMKSMDTVPMPPGSLSMPTCYSPDRVLARRMN